MSNPYQPFFEKLDATIADLEDQEVECALDERLAAADLLKRAGYVLANQLNMQAQTYVHLFLNPPTVEAETEDTSTPHVDEAPDASPDDPPPAE